MGSTPFGRAIYNREVAQLGRALGLGPRGRRFESCLPDHSKLLNIWGLSSAGRAPALHAGGQRFDPARLHLYSEEYPSLAEGIGLENRQAGQTARGFESLFLLHILILGMDVIN
jgi:hypothetical protein